MTQIVVFPRGQLTAQDKKALRAAGVVPVEADDPKAVVVVVPLAEGATVLSADAVLMSLLRAFVAGDNWDAYRAFGAELERRLKAQEATRSQP